MRPYAVDIVATLRQDILPRHFGTGTRHADPPVMHYDASRGPVTFAVHYEHHGKTLVDRAALVKQVGDLLPAPHFKVVGTGVALCGRFHGSGLNGFSG
jgi:hypothetical protein